MFSQPERLVLLSFPVLAVLCGLVYGRASEGRYSPLIPQMTLNAFIQTLTIVATSFLLGTRLVSFSGLLGALLLAMVAILVLIMIMQIIVFEDMRAKTARQIDSILNNDGIRLKPNGVGLGTLRDIGKEMMDVDIIPSGLSEHKLNQRRLFLQLVRGATIQDPGLTQDSFLLPPDERGRLAQRYRWLGGLSFVCFLVSLAMFVLLR